MNFFENIYINLLNNNYNLFLCQNENNDNNNYNTNNYEQDSRNKNILNEKDNLSYIIIIFETNNKNWDIESSKINIYNDKKNDKNLRRYSLDINAFIFYNKYPKEDEENENPNKSLRLTFLITGSDIKTEHLLFFQD